MRRDMQRLRRAVQPLHVQRAGGCLGEHPTPEAVEQRIEQTTQDLGRPGVDPRYGWGLVNAAAALGPS